MKISTLLIFGLSISFFNSCITNKDDADWSDMNLKGKVKSITDSTFQAVEKFGEAIKVDSLISFSKIIFNEHGFKTEEASWDISGFIKLVHGYNGKGLLIQTEQFDQNEKFIAKVNYEYNKEKRRTTENTYNHQGQLIKKSIYRYYSENEIEISDYDSVGELIKTVSSKYNKDGFLIEKLINSEDNDTFDKLVRYKVDKLGRIVEESEYTTEGKMFDFTKSPAHRFEGWYNDNGDLSGFRSYVGDSYRTHQPYYEYDEKHNWIKRIRWAGEYELKQTPQFIDEREIEYYE